MNASSLSTQYGFCQEERGHPLGPLPHISSCYRTQASWNQNSNNGVPPKHKRPASCSEKYLARGYFNTKVVDRAADVMRYKRRREADSKKAYLPTIKPISRRVGNPTAKQAPLSAPNTTTKKQPESSSTADLVTFGVVGAVSLVAIGTLYANRGKVVNVLNTISNATKSLARSYCRY